MGTRGLRVYRYRGRYYYFYNHLDSYPSGLGMQLVSHIPRSSRAAFEAWLQDIRKDFDSFEAECEQELWSIPVEMAKNVISGRDQYRVKNSVDGLSNPPTIWSPCNDIFIEWVYTFDLDRNIFSVNNECHYELSNIPSDWQLAFESADDESPREEPDLYCYTKCALDDRSITLLCTVPEDRAALESFETLEARVVRPIASAGLMQPGKRSTLNFATRLYNSWFLGRAGNVQYLLVQLQSDDRVFRELCWGTLNMLADASGSLALMRTTDSLGDLEYGVVFVQGPTESGVEVIADLASGFHMAGESPWCCPVGDIFWMYGILVYPCVRLDLPSVAKTSIVRLLEKAADLKIEAFSGIIISLTHAVMIRSFPDGKIEHTPILELSNFYPVSDGSQPNPSEPEHESGSSVLDSLGVDPNIDAFAAIAHLFEAAQLKELFPHASASRLPIEMYYKIIDEADCATRLACSQVSRPFREYCQQKWVVDDGTVLRDDGPGHTLFVSQDGRWVPRDLRFEGYRSRGRHSLDDSSGSSWVPVVGQPGKRAMYERLTFHLDPAAPGTPLP